MDGLLRFREVSWPLYKYDTYNTQYSRTKFKKLEKRLLELYETDLGLHNDIYI